MELISYVGALFWLDPPITTDDGPFCKIEILLKLWWYFIIVPKSFDALK